MLLLFDFPPSLDHTPSDTTKCLFSTHTERCHHHSHTHKPLYHHRHASSRRLSALLCLLSAPPWHRARRPPPPRLFAAPSATPLSLRTSAPRTTLTLSSGGSCTALSESTRVTSSLLVPPANLTSQPLLRRRAGEPGSSTCLFAGLGEPAVRQLSRDLRSDLTTSHCVASLLPLEWVFGALHQCDFCFLFAAILASVSFFLSFLPFLGDRNGPAESGAATCSIPGFFLPFLGDVSVPRRAGPLPARYRRWPGVLQVRQGAGFGGGYGQQPCLGDDGILTVDIEDCRYWSCGERDRYLLDIGGGFGGQAGGYQGGQQGGCGGGGGYGGPRSRPWLRSGRRLHRAACETAIAGVSAPHQKDTRIKLS